jgi:hypothetical protein
VSGSVIGCAGRGKIEDGEPPVREHRAAPAGVRRRLPEALAVGSPMRLRAVHPLERRSVDLVEPADDPGNAAHGGFPLAGGIQSTECA